MSFCQPENPGIHRAQSGNTFSCGGCCGILNMKLSKEKRIDLLRRRTREVHIQLNNCKVSPQASGLNKKLFFQYAGEYRKKQENLEISIKRHDPTIYCCVFFGFIAYDESRIGCLIHPDSTKIKESQNAGFYGGSICKNYDCNLKNDKLGPFWLEFFIEFCRENNFDSWTYTLLICDSATPHYIGIIWNLNNREVDKNNKTSVDFFFKQEKNLLKTLFKLRLNVKYTCEKLFNLTSMETIEENTLVSKNQAADFLVNHLAKPQMEKKWRKMIGKICGNKVK